MLEADNEHFVWDLVQISRFVAPTWKFSQNSLHGCQIKMKMGVSKVPRLPRKAYLIFWKRHKNATCHKERLLKRAMKALALSQNAKLNEVAQQLRTAKMTACPAFVKSTVYKHVRKVADACRRLGAVAQSLANTPSTPKHPQWHGNPYYALGKKHPCPHPYNVVLWM